MNNKDTIEFGPGSISSVSEFMRTAFGELSVAQSRPQTGWTFPYNLNPGIVKPFTIFSGVVSHEGSFAKIETGTDPNGVAFLKTIKHLTYTPGIGAVARFTVVFGTPQENSQQLVGIGNNFDGWFFGYDGLKFGIMKRNNEVDEWFYQEDWTEDRREDLDPQKGNVYEIRYQWLGFGMQYFSIEDTGGNLTPVHKIEYANLNTDVSVSNPSLPLSAGVANIGNTTNIILKTPSSVGMVEGEPSSPVFENLVGYEREQTIGPGEIYMFSLKNPADWLGKDNRLYVDSKLLTLASDGNKSVAFRAYLVDESFLTDPVWVDVSPQLSPLQYDISATALDKTNAPKVISVGISKVDSAVIDLSILEAALDPEQIIAVTAESLSTNDVLVGITLRSRT